MSEHKGKIFIFVIVFGIFASIFFNDAKDLYSVSKMESSFDDDIESFTTKENGDNSKEISFATGVLTKLGFIKKKSSNEKTIEISKGKKISISKKKMKKKKRKKRKKRRTKERKEREIDSEEKRVIASAMNFYKKRADYPANSNPTENGKDGVDSIASRIGNNPSVGSSKDGSLKIVSYSPSSHYIINEQENIELFAELYSKGERSRGKISGKIYDENNKYIQDLKYELQDDLTFKADFNPYGTGGPPMTGKYLVKVKGEKKNEGSGKLLVAYKIDSFSLEYRTSKYNKRGTSFEINRNRDLLAIAKYRIYESGLYVIEGTLYNKLGKLISWSESVVSLKKSRRPISVNIIFDGYSLREKKTDGPYTLKNLSMSLIDQKTLAITNTELTQANENTKEYKYTEFREAPSGNPAMYRKIAELTSFLENK